jgi:NitT/TauT family transport system permease protein
MNRLPGKIGSTIKNMDSSVHSVLLMMAYLVLAFFIKKVDLKWAADVLIWPSYLFPNSNFLFIVFELIYAYYFIRVIRFIIRKLILLVRFLIRKETRKQLLVRLNSLPGNFLGIIKSIGRWIVSMPGKTWDVIKSMARWILSLPGKTWEVIKSIGRWIASIPRKTLRATRRLPRFVIGEFAGLGKEFLEMFKNFYRLRTTPGKRISLLLSLILFLVCIKLYYNTSVERHAENPQDKLVPTGEQLWNGFRKTVFEVKIKEEYDANGEVIKNDLPRTFQEARMLDKHAFADGKFRNRREMWKKGVTREYLKQGESLLWQDTRASGRRILIAMVFIFAGIYAGLFIGAFPYAEKFLYRFVLFFDKIPALAVLPILFIVFGLGETAKIALIVIGVAPTVILDTYLKVKEVHDEQLVKGMTLGASQPEIIFRIIFPQIIPKVLDTVRLNFKAVILFLIAGEALAAEAGIGYRIFVVRRYMDMATIFPYVVWISMLAFIVDMAFRMWISNRYQWLNK